MIRLDGRSASPAPRQMSAGEWRARCERVAYRTLWDARHRLLAGEDLPPMPALPNETPATRAMRYCLGYLQGDLQPMEDWLRSEQGGFMGEEQGSTDSFPCLLTAVALTLETAIQRRHLTMVNLTIAWVRQAIIFGLACAVPRENKTWAVVPPGRWCQRESSSSLNHLLYLFLEGRMDDCAPMAIEDWRRVVVDPATGEHWPENRLMGCAILDAIHEEGRPAVLRSFEATAGGIFLRSGTVSDLLLAFMGELRLKVPMHVVTFPRGETLAWIERLDLEDEEVVAVACKSYNRRTERLMVTGRSGEQVRVVMADHYTRAIVEQNNLKVRTEKLRTPLGRGQLVLIFGDKPLAYRLGHGYTKRITQPLPPLEQHHGLGRRPYPTSEEDRSVNWELMREALLNAARAIEARDSMALSEAIGHLDSHLAGDRRRKRVRRPSSDGARGWPRRFGDIPVNGHG